jgi:hypothetical protein
MNYFPVMLKTLLLLTALVLISACSDASSPFIGIWQNPNHKSETIELRKDGTFISSNGSQELQGYWNTYKKGHITITIISEEDSNLLDGRYDKESKQLIITIAGDLVTMERMVQ